MSRTARPRRAARSNGCTRIASGWLSSTMRGLRRSARIGCHARARATSLSHRATQAAARTVEVAVLEPLEAVRFLQERTGK